MSKLTKKDKEYLKSLVNQDIDSIKDLLKDTKWTKSYLGLTKKDLDKEMCNAKLVLKKLD